MRRASSSSAGSISILAAADLLTMFPRGIELLNVNCSLTLFELSLSSRTTRASAAPSELHNPAVTTRPNPNPTFSLSNDGAIGVAANQSRGPNRSNVNVHEPCKKPAILFF